MLEFSLTIYNALKNAVQKVYTFLHLETHESTTGRPLAISTVDSITLAIFKQKQNIATKQSLFDMVNPSCSYKTFVEGINRAGAYLVLFIALILKTNRKASHLLKFTDSTDIPVCLNKNARTNRTMRGLASWSKTGKGWFYGLKLHCTADLEGRVLAIRITSGNSSDRRVFRKMNDLLREVDELKIVGVRPKPEGITERLEALTISREDVFSLQNRGYYLTREGDIMSNEGELQVQTTEGVVYTLRFGEILFGRGEAISAGAESSGDESSGPGENRYLFISAEFDPRALPAPLRAANTAFEGKEESEWTDEDRKNKELADAYKAWEEKVAKGREKADSLTARFAPWYYVIPSSSFDKIHLNRGELVKKKET